MNETVAKIVELLFQDVEMSDEVKAIHDEVMDNCQERFGDLLSRGLSEDEAVAAVVESLKGMEEVLANYPRKQQAEQRGRTSNGEWATIGDGEALFSTEGLRRVAVNLQEEDVIVEQSPDDQVHVVNSDSKWMSMGWDDHDGPGNVASGQLTIRAEMVDGELRVRRADKPENYFSFTGRLDKDRLGGFAKGVFEGDFSFENLGEMVGKLVRGIKNSLSGDHQVRIQVPAGSRLDLVRVNTTSGDVNMSDLAPDTLELTTQSGDLHVEVPGGHRLRKAELHTTSGDVWAQLQAERTAVQSMSGDVRFSGCADDLSVRSTSGDVNVEVVDGVCGSCKVQSISGDVSCTGVVKELRAGTTSGDITTDTASETVGFSSVSGDAEMRLRGNRLRSVEGHTTSGDVTVHVPEGVREADVSARSTSGDITQSIASLSGAPLRIAVHTVSGDIRIR